MIWSLVWTKAESLKAAVAWAEEPTRFHDGELGFHWTDTTGSPGQVFWCFFLLGVTPCSRSERRANTAFGGHPQSQDWYWALGIMDTTSQDIKHEAARMFSILFLYTQNENLGSYRTIPCWHPLPKLVQVHRKSIRCSGGVWAQAVPSPPQEPWTSPILSTWRDHKSLPLKFLIWVWHKKKRLDSESRIKLV